MKGLGRRRRQPASKRSPRVERQKQSIFQYSSNRSQSERSQRGDNPEEAGPPQNRLRKNLYRLGFVLVLLGLAATSFLGGKPQVALTDNQLQLRDTQSYQAAATKAVSGWQSYSKLTFDRQKVAEDIKNAYPEIINVDVMTPLIGRSPVVKLELAQPAVVVSTASDKYALDQRGLALFDLRRAASDFDVSTLPQVEDQTGAPLEVGKPALTSGQVNFITEVKHQSEAKKMPLTSIILTAGGGELHIKHGDLPYFVKYNLYEDPRQSFGTFEATREYTEQHNAKPKEYIDVRVPERAYVK
jgi:hypothetical protein